MNSENSVAVIVNSKRNSITGLPRGKTGKSIIPHSIQQTALPLLDDLPPEMIDDMAALTLLNDAALWRAARSTLPPASQERLDLLLDKKGRGELTVAGQQELDRLLSHYEHIVLTRSQAALLLKQREYDVSDPTILNTPPETPY